MCQKSPTKTVERALTCREILQLERFYWDKVCCVKGDAFAWSSNTDEPRYSLKKLSENKLRSFKIFVLRWISQANLKNWIFTNSFRKLSLIGFWGRQFNLKVFSLKSILVDYQQVNFVTCSTSPTCFVNHKSIPIAKNMCSICWRREERGTVVFVFVC